MPTLYSYCIPYDDGAAPNPYWGICTLAICKPVIRRVAKIGDWVVGTGSKDAPSGDLSNRVVYAMRITDVMSMEDYDIWTHQTAPKKIPDWGHRDIKSRLGDSIYDFTSGRARIRASVHGIGNMTKDLSGEKVLLSEDFYYFGVNAVALPPDLHSIVNQRQGHKSRMNDPYIDSFISWIRKVGGKPGSIHGDPGMALFDKAGCPQGCIERLNDKDDNDCG